MRKLVNSELIIIARESQGITQSELANMLQINQANISRIEGGITQPSEEIVASIAKALRYPISLFFENGGTYNPQVHFRKAKSLAAKDLSKITANTIIDRLRIQKLLNSIEFETNYVRYDLEEYENPESVAITLRQEWQISKGPIKNVVLLLESKGIIVFPVDFGTRFISDLTTKTENGIFVIFLNSTMPPDRKRFTLCHALGHIIMHGAGMSENVELEADRFAAEFLMPSADIKHQLIDVGISDLADLKRYWKTSMASILMKADHLGAITPSRKQYLWKRISGLGYRLNEPVESSILNEEPTLIKEAIRLHKEELKFTEDELKDLLFLRENDLLKYGLNTPPKLKLYIHNNLSNN